MDLTNTMNPQIKFSRTTMDDILARYSVKAAASASTTNKAPASVKTQLSSLLQAKARVLGDRSDDDQENDPGCSGGKAYRNVA